jgi:hypothetical protein
MQDNDTTPIVIDFGEKDTMNESFLRMMGFGIKAILNRMFGGSAIPWVVKKDIWIIGENTDSTIPKLIRANIN